MTTGKRSPDSRCAIEGEDVQERFTTDERARAYLESIRWKHGRVCPHCGNVEGRRLYAVSPNPQKKIRVGLFCCGVCRRQFTVTVGTVFQYWRKSLALWVAAIYVLCSSREGLSGRQLQALFPSVSGPTMRRMLHKTRYAMKRAFVIEVASAPVGSDLEAANQRLEAGSDLSERFSDPHARMRIALPFERALERALTTRHHGSSNG